MGCKAHFAANSACYWQEMQRCRPPEAAPAQAVMGYAEHPKDHRHRLRAVRPYDYTDAAALLAAFWQEVESVMRDKGVWT